MTTPAPAQSGQSPAVWPYCQPGLAALHRNATACGAALKAESSCVVPSDLLVWNGTGAGGQRCVWHAVVAGGEPAPDCQGCVRDGAFAHDALAAAPPPL